MARGYRDQLNPTPSVCLCAGRASMDAVLLRESIHPDSVRTGCSHSIHLLFHQSCSGSSLWSAAASIRVSSASPRGHHHRESHLPCGSEPMNPSCSAPLLPSLGKALIPLHRRPSRCGHGAASLSGLCTARESSQVSPVRCTDRQSHRAGRGIGRARHVLRPLVLGDRCTG